MTYKTETRTSPRTVFDGEPGAPPYTALTFSGLFSFILIVAIATAVFA